jgi:hypothetical protein
MARNSKRSYVGPTKKEAYLYPSRFGSHASMIDEEKTSELNHESKVVLLDEHGHYITYRTRLDNGLSDPKRAYPPRPPLT